MKRRHLFAAAGAAATVPASAVAAPMVLQPGQSVAVSAQIPILKPSDRSVVVGFDEANGGYWWRRSQIGHWNDLTRRTGFTSLEAPPGWLDGLTQDGDVWRGVEIPADVAARHRRYLEGAGA